MNLVAEAVKMALERGATDADAIMGSGRSFSVTVRMGRVETIQQTEAKRLGLRVFYGKRSAIASTSDLERSSLEQLVEQTVTLARLAEEDPYSGLPEAQYGSGDLELGIYSEDVERLSLEERIALAQSAERAALEYDPRIRNSEGAELSLSAGRHCYANSRGFCGQYRSSSISLSVVPVASDNSQMQRDYWYTVGHSLAKIEPPEAVGRKAAQLALRRLGARKIATTRAPVVFDNRVASRLLTHLAEAVAGPNIYRKSSFLVDKLGKKVASEIVNIEDDGRMYGGLGSAPFDGEGLPTRRTPVIEQGVLLNFLLDSYSARKLGMEPTGSAVRSAGGPPTAGPHNFFLRAGEPSPDDIIASVDSGLLVTELIGFGVNLVNGNFSQGAVGIWIENGVLAYPVEEITIAGNLNQMLNDIEMIGNDLEFRGPVAAPTIKIAEMTISGA